MTIPPDKLKHLIAGTVAAAYLGALMLLASQGWYEAAIAGGGTGAMLFVEWYQAKRGNGTPEALDAVAGSIPSWLLAIAVAVVRYA